jgi:hypothetical protein
MLFNMLLTSYKQATCYHMLLISMTQQNLYKDFNNLAVPLAVPSPRVTARALQGLGRRYQGHVPDSGYQRAFPARHRVGITRT